MLNLGPSSSSLEELLSRDAVTICVDTNILVECRALEHLPWADVVPNASVVRIIVPTKVGAEMDAHKMSSGRLRKRAAEFGAVAAMIERNGYAPLVLREKGPTVTIEFGPWFKTRELDGELFDLDDPDNRIVAEAARMARAIPDLVFMSDDSLPIRLAHHVGLAFMRPPTGWRRPDGPDDRDRQIADLTRQLGPQPKLALRFEADEDQKTLALQYAPQSICQDCIGRVVKAILTAFPETPRRVLESRYPHALHGSMFTTRFSTTPGEVTAQDLNDYAAQYRDFALQVQAWARGLPLVLGRRGPVAIVRLQASNAGDRAAEKVHLDVELNGAFKFVALEDFQDLSDDFLQPPIEPAPLGSRVDHLPRVEPRRADRFHEQDVPGVSGERTTSVSWRCEEFRQGASQSLTMLVVAEEPQARGAITARIRGADMAKGVSLTLALRTEPEPSTAPLRDYLRTRLDLLPARFRDCLGKALSATEHDCYCLGE